MKRYVVVLFVFSLCLSIFSFAKDRIVKVEINGNIQTQKFVVLNLLGYKKNMNLNIDALERGQNALLSSGLFSDVYMSLKATGDDYVLVVNLKENPHLFPLMDLEKGIGVQNNDVFGLGLRAYGSVRLFNISPFKLLWGGYSLGVDSSSLFGTSFALKLEYSNLKGLWWQMPAQAFFYDRQSFEFGIGYKWKTNKIMLTYEDKNSTSTTNLGKSTNVKFVSFTLNHVRNLADSQNRSYWEWNVNLEHGLNIDYTTASLNVENYYRMIAQIYLLTRSYSVFNGANTPFMFKRYFGQTNNLKGYNLRNFSATFMSLWEEKLGIPLTSSLKISKSPKLTFLTPEFISQVAFLSDENFSLDNFKLSLGIGIKMKTPIGVVEPEMFLGKALEFYLEF